ncbi:uncharacterized protein A4U43_C04F14840 [Asparagus officinalis]|uniref:peroxidase n=1 Tax=Asparagus officinalis TaxID=4686 RepID=A0A5P1F2R6_ASPOF|nr:uncharacterized protein A4U43_C04F14840 [Asparagus officinalis]
MIVGEGKAQLRPNFYRRTCPNVELIVRQAVMKKIRQTFVTVPATLRLFFHDCFVSGCDASVLISSARGDAERDAADNLSLAGDGFDTVDKAKQAVEAQCPGVVSCADILALAARDVVVLSGGPWFNVELGRRLLLQLPVPGRPISQRNICTTADAGLSEERGPEDRGEYGPDFSESIR